MNQANSGIPATLLGSMAPGFDTVLTPGALRFISDLHRRFNSRRVELLAKRQERQAQIDKGILPDFLPETQQIRDADWKIAPVPRDLQDRRVELTGPVDRKMVRRVIQEELDKIKSEVGDAQFGQIKHELAGELFEQIIAQEEFEEFLTLKAYEHYE